MEEIQKALSLKSELDLLRPLSVEQENRIMQKFRLDWNYHSNHLEGNTLTYGETKALILFGVTAQGKPLKDTLEITGHNEAIDWVIDMVKGERPLTENFIRELHKLLLREPYEKKAISSEGLPISRKINVGSYKTTPNHVLTATGETFYFASPEETPAKMHDLIEWYREKREELNTNPILLAAEFHYKFIRIHPFDDGNGRTARILMNFILMQYSFPPVIIRTEDKENYFAVLRMADAGNLEAFVAYIAQNLNRSLEIMIAGAKGENIEEEDDLEKEIALLEQRLNNYGEKIEKYKSPETIKDVFKNSIIPFAEEIRKKLLKFENYYLFKNIFIVNDNKSYSLSNFSYPDNNCNTVRIIVDYNTIKKKGLEEFRFHMDFSFKFNSLNYTIFETKYDDNILLKKEYDNLTEKEMKQLIEFVVIHHNTLIQEAINENS